MFSKTLYLASFVGALSLAGAAMAGNGAGSNKSTSSSSISSPVVVSTAVGTVGTASTTTSPTYGDTITFDVSTTETDPYVNLTCFQNGSQVSEGWAAFRVGAERTFVLDSPLWSGGSADCTADLGVFANNGKWKVLASASFHVGA
jgi:hypothetical protein